VVDAFEVVARAAHKQVAKAAEVGAVLHFLGKDVGDVAFTAYVHDCDCAVSNPFMCRVFKIFNVLVAFGGHIVALLDTCVIIIVERCWRVGIVYGVAKFEQAGDHVSGVDHEAGSHVGCANFWLCMN
jgi:hypothetical protein